MKTDTKGFKVLTEELLCHFPTIFIERRDTFSPEHIRKQRLKVLLVYALSYIGLTPKRQEFKAEESRNRNKIQIILLTFAIYKKVGVQTLGKGS